MTAVPPGAYGHAPDDFSFTAPEQPARKPRRTALFVTIALIAVLAIGGGAFALARALSGGGDQPADALPADTVAYARLDIDPSLGQKISALDFLNGLSPETRDLLESTDIREEFFNEITGANPGLSGLDYQNDIEPWIGDRLGVGVIPNDGDQEPIVAIALQVTDETAANEAIETLVTNLGDAGDIDWFFHGDYVVFTEGPHAADVEGRVNNSTLADTDNFRADHDDLGDHGVASFWVDMDAVTSLAQVGNTADELDYAYPELGGLPGLLTSGASGEVSAGRMAAAIRLGDNYVEVHGIAHGHEASIEGGDSPLLITDLPDDTFIALGVEHGDQWVDMFWTLFGEIAPDELAEAQQQAAAEGVTLPEDLKVLAGQSAVVSVGPSVFDTFGGYGDHTQGPEFAVQVSTQDTDRAQQLVALMLAGSPDGQLPPDVPLRIDGSTYTVGGQQSYVDAVATGGSLGDTDLFRGAVPNADGADVLGFVNLTTLSSQFADELSHDPETAAIVNELGAIGFSADVSGTETEFTLRLVGRN